MRDGEGITGQSLPLFSIVCSRQQFFVKRYSFRYFNLSNFFKFENDQTGNKISDEAEDKRLQQLSSICKQVIEIFQKQSNFKLELLHKNNIFEFKLLPKPSKIAKKFLVEVGTKKTMNVKTNRRVLLHSLKPNIAMSWRSTNLVIIEKIKLLHESKMVILIFSVLATLSFEKILKKNAYYYHSNLKTGASHLEMKRIAREIQSLQSGLMLTLSSSAFVRSCEEHLDALKVIGWGL